MSGQAVRWVPSDRDRCTKYKINKSMFMFMFMFVVVVVDCAVLNIERGVEGV